MKDKVLVLNADYTPMSNVSIQHAFRMINRGVVTVEEEHETELINGFWPVPTKLRLLRYVNMSWFYSKPVTWSKRGILIRDQETCAYCLGKAETIDHIIPVSKGGKSTWENCVAACFPCNSKKDNKSLEQIGWKLQITPRVPTRVELTNLKLAR